MQTWTIKCMFVETFRAGSTYEIQSSRDFSLDRLVGHEAFASLNIVIPNMTQTGQAKSKIL